MACLLQVFEAFIKTASDRAAALALLQDHPIDRLLMEEDPSPRAPAKPKPNVASSASSRGTLEGYFAPVSTKTSRQGDASDDPGGPSQQR